MVRRVFAFYSLPLYILTHPIKGFYEMKFESRGSLKIALLNFVLMSISFSFLNQYTSILVTPRHPMVLNSIRDFISLSMVLVLFCASNWAVTSITDGEGKFKEILMTVCYAMTPLVLILIPATLFSNILTMQEVGFHALIISVAVAWFVMVVFVGLIVIQNYSVVKALITLVLTLIALLVIVFLITLLFTLIEQVSVFVGSLYREVSLRRYS